MSKLSYLGWIKDGKLTLDSPERMKQEMRKMGETRGVRVEVTVEKYSENKKKSRDLEEYLWGVVYDMIARETGHTKEECHEIYKMMFNPVVISSFDGSAPMVVGGSTASSKFTLKKQLEFVESVRQHAATFHHLNIPEPNEGMRDDSVQQN